MSGQESAPPLHPLLAGANALLARVRESLLSPTPQNLDIASSSLAKVVIHISDLQAVLIASPSSDLADAILGFRQDFAHISRLLERAAAYHVQLSQRMFEAAIEPVPMQIVSAPAPGLNLEA